MKYLGFIKWFDAKKKYGFIVRSDGGDVHFYQSNVDISPSKLLEGIALIFKIKEQNPKPTAIEVSMPENFDDFSFIMSVSQGAYGSTTIAKAIAQLFKNNPLLAQVCNLCHCDLAR